MFGFYAYLAMPLTGGFAALLVASLPVFFTFCRSSLSEISASALIALAFMVAYLGLKEEHRWKIYLSAIFLAQAVASGTQTDWNRLQAWDAFYFPTPPLPSPWLTAERHFFEMFGRQSGIVLADINPPYLNALLPDTSVAAHLDGERYVNAGTS